MIEVVDPIPEKISRKEFVEAIGPLCELLKVTPEEACATILIRSDVIEFYVIAREEGDNGVFPHGIIPAAPRQDFSELCHAVRVEIV